MDTLANEVLIQIFALCETVDLGRLMRCSRRFHQLITDDYMWKEAFRKRWGHGHSSSIMTASSSWRNEYCKRSNELDFWKDCNLKGKGLFLKNWIPDQLLDISTQKSSNTLRVLSSAGIHSCRLSSDYKDAPMERHSSYFSRQLLATCAHFYPGFLVVGMNDGDLYVTEDQNPSNEKEQVDLQSGRRFNSSAIRMPLRSIDLITEETLLISYQGDQNGYFQLALWKFKGQRRWLWHVGEQGVINWSWMKRRGEGEDEELLVLLAQKRKVSYYRFDLSSEDSLPDDQLTNLEYFAPLAKTEHSWTFNDSAIEQVAFASPEHFLVRTQKSLEMFRLSDKSVIKHERSLLIKCNRLWTGDSIGMVLLSLADGEGLSLLNCHNQRLLQLPLPSGFTLPLQDVLVGDSVCLALAQYSLAAFDVFNGALLSHRRLQGLKSSAGMTDAYHLKPLTTNFQQLGLYSNTGGSRLHLLSFSADEDEAGQKPSPKTSEPKKPPINPATSLLRQEIADWRSECHEEERLEALREKFNLEAMSEEEMLKLAISLSGGQLPESACASASAGSECDTDLEIALRLSIQEQ